MNDSESNHVMIRNKITLAGCFDSFDLDLLPQQTLFEYFAFYLSLGLAFICSLTITH